MAKFILGSIITDIAGSIGGTTLRRSQTGHIMYNKQGRQIKSAFKPKNKRVALASLFQRYSFLTPIHKNKWNEQAQLFTFPDKFGIYRKISGRLLYIKLNGALLPSDLVADVNILNSKLPAVTVTGFVNDFSNDNLYIKFDKNLQTSILYVSAFPVSAGASAVSKIRKAPLLILKFANTTSVNIHFAITNAYPFLRIGDRIAINVSILNESGFAQPVQAYTLVLE